MAFLTVLLGGIALSAAEQSRGPVKFAAPFVIWYGGLFLTMCALFLAMTNLPNLQHTSEFFRISSLIYPGVLLAVGAASRSRWAMTGTALVYCLISGLMVWVLPLFPAHPLTAPIHNPMDHLMPPPFPLLLIGPAVVMDWLRSRFVRMGGLWVELLQGGVLGLGFVAMFIPVQWFFASFLLSSGADNWFFAGGGKHWPFFLKIDEARAMFWGAKQDPLTWHAILWTTVFAMFSSVIGFRVGKWLRNLCR
jgi:hypothetical protein